VIPPTDDLRFHPPRLRPSPDLSWVLHRAFGPPDASPSPPADPGRALDLARDLDLLGRIASRVPAPRLRQDLGHDAFEAALDERRSIAAWALRVLRTARFVAEAAETLDLPVAFLKGAAMHLAEHTPIAARCASDVDVLVPADRAATFHSALVARGFRSPGPSGSAHHLAPLVRDDALPVEVHLCVPGCPLPGPDPATHDSLDRAGLLRPLGGLPGRARVPAPAFLAAHALVHGIEDHGFGPDRYPPLRMVCDLADLVSASVSDAPTRAAVRRLVGPEVSPLEFQAALDLVERLARGNPPTASDRTPECLLLAHLVAGALDDDYQEALRLRQVAWLLRHRPLATVREKLAFRWGALPPASGPGRAWRTARHLARLVGADLRLRFRSMSDG